MSTEFINDQWRLPNAWNGSESNVNKQSNYSMDFASSRVNLGTSLDLGINSTISLWLNTSTFGGNMLLSEASYQYGYFMYMDGSNIILVIGSSSPKYYTHSMVVGQWYHLVIVRQGTSIEIFINNTSLGTQTGFGTTVSTKFDTFGGKTTGGYAYTGKLDGLSAFNYALSSSQVTTLYGSSSTGIGNPMTLNPVAYYPLGDQDAFNGSNYLVPNSSLKDYVFDFNGSSQYIDCGNDSSLNISGDLTISAWVYMEDDTWNPVVSKTTDANNRNYEFAVRPTTRTITFYTNNGSYETTTTSLAVSLNTWTHIVISCESGVTNGTKFYFNNALDTTTGTHTITADTADLYLGVTAWNSFANYFNGKISKLFQAVTPKYKSAVSAVIV